MQAFQLKRNLLSFFVVSSIVLIFVPPRTLLGTDDQVYGRLWSVMVNKDFDNPYFFRAKPPKSKPVPAPVTEKKKSSHW